MTQLSLKQKPLKYLISTSLCILFILLFYFNSGFGILGRNLDKIKGITMVAPPKPFPIDPMNAIKKTNANWVAIIPYAFSRKGKPEVHFEIAGGQWWGETSEGIRESIQLAKAAGLHIMLKPQVWIHDHWVGNMDFKTEEEWKRWEDDYKKYILQNVKIAAELQVDMICIATEYNIAAVKREAFFRKLIAEIKSMYSGKLSYCSTWNNYRDIPFWDDLDYIGISAYFPLIDDTTPTIEQLTVEWQKIIRELESFSEKTKKKILFTEFGYLSVDGCAGKTWEIENQIESRQINHIAQANAYEALFSSFWEEGWWAGGFVWKWFPNGEGHEGYPEKDYTPQGKNAEHVLTKWYGR